MDEPVFKGDRYNENYERASKSVMEQEKREGMDELIGRILPLLKAEREKVVKRTMRMLEKFMGDKVGEDELRELACQTMRLAEDLAIALLVEKGPR